MPPRPAPPATASPPLPTGRRYRWLFASASCGSAGALFLCIPLLWPLPLVILAGTVLGVTLMLAALGLYVAAVILDLKHHQVV